MFRKKIIYITMSLAISTLVFTGCATTTATLPQYEAKFKMGDFKGAKEISQTQQKDILWSLQEATASKMQNDYISSNKKFDFVDNEFRKYDEQILAGAAVENIGAVLVNDSIMDYQGTTYDKVMTNTYKAMNFMLLNDSANARVEFNRALERQKMAQEYFEKEIAVAEQKVDQDKKKNKINTTKSNDIDNVISEKYKFLDQYEKYPNFNNPFANYMAGLYFMKVNDCQKAVDILKETYGMTKNVIVESDFTNCINTLDGKKESIKYAHVIYESGYASKKADWKIALPIPIPQGNSYKVFMPSLALPTLQESVDEMPFITVTNGENKLQSIKLASMDGVIASEFEKRFPMILTRAVLRTTTDLILQKVAGDKGGLVGQLGVGVLGALKNNSDVRSWQSLPKNFSVIKIPLNNEQIRIVDAKGKVIVDERIDPSKDYIYVVRAYNSIGGAYYDKVTF